MQASQRKDSHPHVLPRESQTIITQHVFNFYHNPKTVSETDVGSKSLVVVRDFLRSDGGSSAQLELHHHQP